MQWLRWYNETTKDFKFRLVAKKAGEHLTVVLSVWASLLEHASENGERGSLSGYDFEMEDVVLDLNSGTTERVYKALESVAMIESGRLTAWDKRQFSSDSSTERSQKSRNAKKSANIKATTLQYQQANDDGTPCNDEATLQERSNNVDETPLQSTELQSTELQRAEGTDFQRESAHNPAPTMPPDGGDAPSERFDLSAETVPKPPRDDCPHQKIVELYHEILPELPHVHSWGDKNRANLRARWRGSRERQNLDWWREFFQYVGQSDFLMGRICGRDGKPFFANLGWLVTSQNFDKVLNGNYNHGALDVFEQAKRLGYDEIKRQAFGSFGSLRDEIIDIDGEVPET